MSDRPYSRLYWETMEDPKFDGVREDVTHFGTWSLMLILAEMAYPVPAFVPAVAPPPSVTLLAERGLIDLLSGGRYRMHGLAAERAARSEHARDAANARWNAPSIAPGNAPAVLAETSIDEQSKDEQVAYFEATGRIPRSPALLDWLHRLWERYGEAAVRAALRTEVMADASPGSLMGRTERRLFTESAAAASAERAAEARKVREQHAPVVIRPIRSGMSAAEVEAAAAAYRRDEVSV